MHNAVVPTAQDFSVQRTSNPRLARSPPAAPAALAESYTGAKAEMLCQRDVDVGDGQLTKVLDQHPQSVPEDTRDETVEA